MNKKSLLILLFLVLALSFVVLPTFFTFDEAAKHDIAQKMADKLGYKKIEITGDVRLKMFPTPALSINQVFIALADGRNLALAKIELATNYDVLFSDSFEVKGIKLIETEIQSSDVLSFFQNPEIKNESKLERIELEDVDILFTNPDMSFTKIDNITGYVDLDPKKRLISDVKFYIDDLEYKLKADVYHQSSSSNLEISNPYFSANFTGTPDFTTKHFNGDYKFTIKHQDLNANPSEIQTFTSLLLIDNFTAQSNFTYENGVLKMPNIAFHSNSIQEGAATFEMNVESFNELNFNFKVNQIDLDKIFGYAKNSTVNKNYLDQLLKFILINFNLHPSHDLVGGINGKIGKITLEEQNILDVNFDSTFLDGKYIVQDFSASMPGDAKLIMTGNLSHNKVRPKFDGNIKLDIADMKKFVEWSASTDLDVKKLGGNTLQFTSELALMPRSLRLDNVKASIGDIRSVGKLNIKHYGEQRLYVRSNMRYNKLDLDVLGLTTSFDDYVTKLYAYDYDRNGNKLSEISDEFAWLRNFNTNLSLEVYADQLNFKGVNYSDAHVSASISPSLVSVDEFAIKSDDVETKFKFDFTTATVTPKLEGDIRFVKLTDKFFPKILPSPEALESATLEILKKEDKSGDIKPDYVNYYSLNGINANVNFAIENYISDSIKFSNLESKIAARSGIITISELKAKLFSGDLNLSGNIIATNLVGNYYATFSLNNFEADELLTSIFGYKNLEGSSSLGGTLNTKGYRPSEFIPNLNGKLDYLGAKITLHGLDIGNIVVAVDAKATLTEKLSNINYYSINGETVFDKIKGEIKIDSGLASIGNVQLSNNRASAAYAANVDLRSNSFASAAALSFNPRNSGTLQISMKSKGLLRKPVTEINLEKVNNYLLQMARIESSKNVDAEANRLLRNRIVVGEDLKPSDIAPETSTPQ